MESGEPACQQDTSRPAKGKRGREPTIVIVFFHITTIVGESSQKLNKIGKTFSSRCAVPHLVQPHSPCTILQTSAKEAWVFFRRH
jgi:hypothetical protein